MILGGPSLVIWVVCLPLIGLILLWKNIKKNDSNKVKQYFLILYQGFKRDIFYWEFINSGRKMLILMCFLLEGYYRVFFSLSILIIIWRVQHKLKPYKKEENNSLEMLGINVAIITLSCGFIFDRDHERSTNALDFLLLLLILLLNIIFILQWIAIYIIALGEQYPFLIKVGRCIQMICFMKIQGGKLPVTTTQKAKTKKIAKKVLKTPVNRNNPRKKKFKRRLRKRPLRNRSNKKKQIFPRRDMLNTPKSTLSDENVNNVFNDGIKRVQMDHNAFDGDEIGGFSHGFSHNKALFKLKPDLSNDSSLVEIREEMKKIHIGKDISNIIPEKNEYLEHSDMRDYDEIMGHTSERNFDASSGRVFILQEAEQINRNRSRKRKVKKAKHGRK